MTGDSDPINQAIEAGALARFVGRQRWFAGRSRGLESVRVRDEASLGFDHAGLSIVEVRHHDGSTDPYFIPWSRTDGDSDDRWTIAPGLRDGLADPSVSLALLDRLGRGEPIPTRSGGSIVGVPTRAHAEIRGATGPAPEPTYGWIEQSHSALRFGGALFLKVFRRLESGINPDFEVGRFLNEQTEFRQAPAMAGALEYRAAGSEPMTLAILQPWLESIGTAWDCGRRDLDRVFELPADKLDSALHGEETRADQLGRRTGELHRALASRPDDPAFAPRAIHEADIAAILEESRNQLERSMTALRGALPDLAEDVRGEAVALLGQESGFAARLARPPETRGRAIRIHGDYHLGQVLRTAADDFLIIDFEGEPGQPLDRRRGRHPALRDVVGMIRSMDYAAHAATFRHHESRSPDRSRIAFDWRDRCTAAFLRGYQTAAGTVDATSTARGNGSLANGDSWFGLLLLHKALYELSYEINQRPTWVRVPLRGLLALADSHGQSRPD